MTRHQHSDALDRRSKADGFSVRTISRRALIPASSTAAHSLASAVFLEAIF